jgi:hypothetical protein
MVNINIRKSNFTVSDGYFFTFDEDQDALLQKTDDGNTAFSYPCDVLLSNTVKSLEFDGINFWSLETVSTTLIIKRWRIINYLIKLQQTITLDSSGSHTYNASCFTVEHFHTRLTLAADLNTTTLYIDAYSNMPEIITNAVIHIGPNENGEEEDIAISGTIFGGITLSAPLVYSYALHTPIDFHKYIWIFNNNDGVDTSTGALYKFDSHSGAFIKKFPGGAYKAITACTYYTISSFQELGSRDMLLFAKGTNTLFINTSDYKRNIYDADVVNDQFTTLDTNRWSVTSGTPTIQSNTLYLNPTAAPSTESIKSVYSVTGDFDVYVNGNLSSYNSGYSGAGCMENSLGLYFPNEQDRFCKISRGYSTIFGGGLYQNFSVTVRKATDSIFTTVSGTEYDAGTNRDIYSLRIKRVDTDVHFYYRTTTGGSLTAWRYLGVVPMFSSDANITLSSYNATDVTIINSFDDFTFTGGNIVYLVAATELPFYGSMVMDNITNNTVLVLEDMAVDRNNLYRLQGGGTYDYYLSPLESFVTSISLSASPAIIAANGLSTTNIKAWVKDQFLQPIKNRRVTFSETGDGIITGGTDLNTDVDGFVQTIYRAGNIAQDVVVTATVQQTN